MQRNDAGSIPTVNKFIACLDVVNVMEKRFFHVQTKPAPRRQMLTAGERLNPPPEMLKRGGGSGGGAFLILGVWVPQNPSDPPLLL